PVSRLTSVTLRLSGGITFFRMLTFRALEYLMLCLLVRGDIYIVRRAKSRDRTVLYGTSCTVSCAHRHMQEE
ncbi:MAG TPA: hypothetical protein VN371_07325, partial [Chlorobaculum sp.]|nr:hypothetical protein [Chlorobaculum sp.]